MRIDHFIPLIDTVQNELAGKLQTLALQSVQDAINYEDTRLKIQPYVSNFPYRKLPIPDNFKPTYPYKKSLTLSNSFKQDAPVPYLSDVINIALDHGTAEYIVISHPDVLLKPNFYLIIEHYLSSGHDAIAIRTSNSFADTIENVNVHNLQKYTWGYYGFGLAYDAFVIKRTLLAELQVAHAYATTNGGSQILMYNLLSCAKHFKHLYEDSIICRLNNIGFNGIFNFSPYEEHNSAQYKKIKNLITLPPRVLKKPVYTIIDLLNVATHKPKLQPPIIPYEGVEVTMVPVSLTGTMWGIGTYFNPNNNSVIKENYNKFSRKIREQGLPLLTVELAFEGQEFCLTKDDADIIVQVQDGDIMWQKERMFNLGVTKLPDECDKVVFLDCDIFFESSDWIQKTAALLNDYIFVQPYAHVVRLEAAAEPQTLEHYEAGWHNGQVIHSFGWGIRQYGKRAFNFYPHHGCVGMVIAARRDVIQRHKIYDSDIIGSGDLLTIDSIFKIDNLRTELMNPIFKEHFLKWRKGFYKEVKGSLSFIDEVIYHLWHGNTANRFYEERYRILEENNFNPTNDIKLSPQGVWQWNSDKIAIHEGCKNYFSVRDDG